MTNKLFIQNLIAHNVNFLLWGSEAGILHGYDIYSNKDIDLIIQNTEINLNKLYTFLSKFFNISLQQLIDTEAITIKTSDKKYFDIRKKYVTPVWVCDYDTAIKEAICAKFLDCYIRCISRDHYVKILELAIFYPKKSFTHSKLEKYKKVISTYKNSKI